VISPGNYVYLESPQGGYVGGSQNYSYTSYNASLYFSEWRNSLFIRVIGDELWTGQFTGMQGFTQMESGYYGNLKGIPYNPAMGCLSWVGDGWDCSSWLMSGWLAIDHIAYFRNGTLSSIKMRFEQVCCEAGSSALHGAMAWAASNPINPPGPINPPPKELWTPPEIAISAGNYVYLESDPGDSVGKGLNYSYNSSNAIISVSTNINPLSVSINGNEQWTGDFQSMSSLQQLTKGYYGDLQHHPFYNPVLAGLSWGGFCNSRSGWFVVDEINYNSTGLVAVKLRFAQHCLEAVPALYGALNWNASNPDILPRPVNPPPEGLWTPDSKTVSASGNYVYLESQQGDNVGGGLNYSYTPSNSTLSVSYSDFLLYVQVQVPMGYYDEYWSGYFQGMETDLEVGYYGGLRRYPVNNPVLGGLFWYGSMYSDCDTLSGWFVVDSIQFVEGEVSAVQLRFEQHCEAATPALHGAISWKSTTSLT